MPRLPVPQSDPRLPQQIFTAESQGAAVARADQDLARSVVGFGAALQQRQTQNEVSKLNAEFAKAQAELAVEWQDTLRTADPSDPETASRFREERVKARLDQLQGIAQTREGKDFYTRLSAGLGANFLQTTEQGMSGLREVAAVESFETVKNQMADAIRANPLSFDTTRASSQIMLEGYVQAYGLSREQALKLSTEIAQEGAMAAALGRIDADPDEGRAFVDAGGFSEFLDARSTRQVLDYADNLKASRVAEAKRAREESERAADIQWMQSISEGSYRFEDLVKDPRLDADKMRSIASAARAHADQGAADDPVAQSFNFKMDMDRAFAGEISSQEIWSNVGDRKYKPAEARILQDIVEGDTTPQGKANNEAFKDFQRAAEASMVRDEPLKGIVDPEGRAKYTAYIAQVRRQFMEARERGENFDVEFWLQDLDKRRLSPEQAIESKMRRLNNDARALDLPVVEGPPAPARKYKSIEEYNKARGE